MRLKFWTLSMTGHGVGVLVLWAAGSGAGWAGDEMASRKPWISVVEMPSGLQAQLAGKRPERPHHGLKFGGEAPTHALRAMGLAVSDCSTQVRVPTRLSQTANGIQADLRAEMRLGCRF